MIKVDYLTESRRVQLTTDNDGPAWIHIRRSCSEATDEFEDIGPSSFSIPWWRFITLRSGIGYYAKEYKEKIEVDAIATRLLKQSLEKEKSFKSNGNDQLKIDEISTRLAEQGFKRSITDKQERNLFKLLRHNAAATFSVPGAGKTTEALAYFKLKKKENTKLLVIAPKNAFAAWEEQVSACFPECRGSVTRLTGGQTNIRRLLANPSSILLVTYQQVPTVIDLLGDLLTEHSCMIFLDESHRMKRGTSGVIGKSILSLSHLPDNKLIMSGTPMPNSKGDLIPQFNFLYPEVKADESTVTDLIKQVFVRTTKKELNLPPPIRVHQEVALTSSQQYLYSLLRSEIAMEAANLKTADRYAIRRFSRSVLKLIQLVSNPMLLSKSYSGHEGVLSQILLEEDSPKIEWVCNRARELALEGKKTVIWSTFVENVELIAARLSDLKAEYIHGGVEAGSDEEEDTREAKIKRFHDDQDTFVLVANPAACSEGISLHTVCHHAIYLDRNFNAAQYLQSEDRIHRFGLSSDQKTYIEIVTCPGTIDDVVDSRLREKVRKMGEVLEDSDLNIDPVDLDPETTDLESDDLKEVLQYLHAEGR